MAQFSPFAVYQHRDQFVVFRLEFRIGIDVDDIDLEMRHPCLSAQGLQRGEHVVAEVAVIATEQVQARRRPLRQGTALRLPRLTRCQLASVRPEWRR